MNPLTRRERRIRQTRLHRAPKLYSPPMISSLPVSAENETLSHHATMVVRIRLQLGTAGFMHRRLRWLALGSICPKRLPIWRATWRPSKVPWDPSILRLRSMSDYVPGSGNCAP
jgi:hypothetical protein